MAISHVSESVYAIQADELRRRSGNLSQQPGAEDLAIALNLLADRLTGNSSRGRKDISENRTVAGALARGIVRSLLTSSDPAVASTVANTALEGVEVIFGTRDPADGDVLVTFADVAAAARLGNFGADVQLAKDLGEVNPLAYPARDVEQVLRRREAVRPGRLVEVAVQRATNRKAFYERTRDVTDKPRVVASDLLHPLSQEATPEASIIFQALKDGTTPAVDANDNFPQTQDLLRRWVASDMFKFDSPDSLVRALKTIDKAFSYAWRDRLSTGRTHTASTRVPNLAVESVTWSDLATASKSIFTDRLRNEVTPLFTMLGFDDSALKTRDQIADRLDRLGDGRELFRPPLLVDNADHITLGLMRVRETATSPAQPNPFANRAPVAPDDVVDGLFQQAFMAQAQTRTTGQYL